MMDTTKKPLTMKQAKLVKGIAEGKTKQEAGVLAGYGTTPESAAAIVSETLKIPSVKEAIERVMEKQGITMERIIEPVNKALSATKVVIHGNGEEAFAEVVEDIELQLKGHDRAMKLMTIGMNKGDTPIQANVVNIINEQKNEYGL